MRRIVLACVLCYWMIVSTSLMAPRHLGATAADTGDILTSVDAYVEQLMDNDRVPGVAVAIVRGQEVVHLRGFGVADPAGTPVTPQTPFVLGSMSKSFTALAIMQLVEAGTIELDAPVQRYIPWFTLADPAAAAQITIRQLLDHTSGIPTNAPQAANVNPTLADHVRALATTRLNHPPGTFHEYASPNYQILGLIIEVRSGQPFSSYLQKRIFAPLTMVHSYTDETAAIAAGLAVGHQYWLSFPQPSTLPYEPDRLPTAAIISSAEDLSRYLIAQLNDGRYGDTRVLRPELMAELHRPSAPADDFSYAMGWRVGPVKGVPAIHHGGMLPHYRGKLVLLPESGWGVAVLTNASSFFGRPTSHDLADGIAAILSGQPAPSQTLSLGLFLLLITAGLGLITLNQIMTLARLGHWRRQVSAQPTPALKLWLPIVIELVFPVLLLVGLPALLGLPLTTLQQQLLDVTLWLYITAFLGLLIGLGKAWIAVATQRRGSGE